MNSLLGITIPDDFDLNYIEEKEFSIKDVEKALDLYNKNLNENPFKEISFTILGEPKAWNRAVKLKYHVYDPNVGTKNGIKTEVYKQLESLGYKDFQPFNGEIELSLVIYKSIPKSLPKYKKILAEAGILKPLSKPDFDNYVKLLSDTLNNILFRDDAQVTFGKVEKKYSFKPRYEFTIKYREFDLF
jgi:Holliday junction resolvase RusA-like endonuclease